MPDPRQKLYTALSSKFDLGSFEEFNSKMNNPESRKKLYNSVSSNFDLGSYEEFEGKIGKKKSTSTSTSGSQKSVSVPQAGSSAGNTSNKPFKNLSTGENVDLDISKELKKKEVVKPISFNKDTKAKDLQNRNDAVLKNQQKDGKFVSASSLSKNIPSEESIAESFVEGNDLPFGVKKGTEEERKFKEKRALELKSALQKHDQATTVDETFINEAVAEAEEIAGGNNTWENVKSGAKGMFNTWLAQNPAISGIALSMGVNPYQNTDPLAEEKTKVRKELIDSGVDPKKINDADVLNGAKKLYAKNKITDKKLSLSNEFYRNISDEEKQTLDLNYTYDKSKLTNEENRLIQELKITKARIEDITFDAEPILTKIKNKEQISPEEFKILESLDKQINLHNDIYDDYQSNSKSLLSAKEEFDLVKRQYGKVENLVADLSVNIGKLGLSAVQLLNTASGVNNPEFSANLGKKQADLEKWNQTNFQKLPEESYTFNDGVNWLGDLFGNQATNVGLMIATGGGSTLATRAGLSGNQLALGVLGTTSYGNKKNELSYSNSIGETNYSQTQIELQSILYGSVNSLETATLGSLGKVKKFFNATLSEAPTRELFRKSFLQNTYKGSKELAKDLKNELFEEHLANLGENFGRVYILKDPKATLTDNTLEVTKSTIAMTFVLKSPQIAGAFIKKFQPKEYNDVLDKNASEVLKLMNELKKADLTPETKKVIDERISKLAKESDGIIKNAIEKIVKMPMEQKEKVVELEKSTADLRAKAEAIQKDESLSKEMKENLIKDLSSQYKTQEDLRTKIVSEKATILDILPENEVNDLKKKAVETLLVENAGKNEANFTEEIIDKKAIELYNQSNNNQISEPTETNTSEQITEEIPTNNQITPSENASPINEVNNNQDISEEIKALENSRDVEIEDLKAKRQFNKQNVDGIKEKYNSLITQQKNKETEAKIKNKELFSDGGNFSNQLGDSGVNSVATNHTEINGIEFVQFSNPNTGMVDVVMSGTSASDFVGYYRIYENGKPTDKWSSKFENQSRNKDNFKTMIGGVQSMLPEGHQYTETTSISTDGLRVWEQQLSRGYELQTDNNGNIVTNVVAINGDAINNELGIEVNKGNFDNISVTNNQQFESVKKALLPYLQKFGLNESNIRNVNGTVEIDLPVLRKTTKQNEATPSQDIADDGNIRPSDAVVDQDGSANKGDKQGGVQQPSNLQGNNGQTKVTTKTIISKTAKGADSEFDVDTDDNNNIVEVRSKKDGRIIPKFVERKTKQIDKVNGGFKTILAKNANYAKIEADYYGTKTDNQIKVENEKQFNDTVQNFDASNEYEAALVSLATGSKVSKESLQNETGNSDNKWATNQFSTEQLPNIETLAEQIVENSPLELDVQEVRNALIDIITSNQAIEDVKNEVVSKYDEKNKSFQEEELNAYLGTLNEEELAKYEANRVDEEFISELTDNEVIEYFQQKLEEYEQGQRATTEEGESAKKPIESRQAIADSNENQQRKEEQPAAEVDLSFFENITNQDNIQDGLDWLDNLMLDPNDLKVTLPFLPQTWNAFIEAIKIAYKAGNTMSKAIQEGIKALEALGTSKSEIDAIVDAFTKKASQQPAKKNNTPPKQQNKKPIDKESIEKDSFEDMAGKMPNSGIVGEFLSGKTTEKTTGDAPEGNQEYDKIKLIEAFTHGKNIINKAIEQFGDNYVASILDYIENYQLNPENIALAYISLENHLRDMVKMNPNDITIKKQFDLVQSKRQNYAKSVAQAMNMAKLQNMAYYGYDLSETVDLIFTESQLETKRKIERAIQASADDINNEAEFQENEAENDIEEITIKAPKRKRNANVVKKELDDVWKNMLNDIAKSTKDGTLQTALPYQKQIIAATPHILKATQLLAELGTLSSKQIIDEIYNKLKTSFPDIERSDIVDIIKNENNKPKTISKIVKKALIDAGFGREVNITKKDENGNKVKEKRNILDWKKLAGEEGSVENIKKNVEETLKKQGYSEQDIKDIQTDLETEYTNLRASIIEKSLNELERRNTPKNINAKTHAQRLAELYNYGLFETNASEYDNLLNGLLGMNDFDNKTYEQLKQRGEALAELYATGLDPLFISTKIDELQKQINDIVYKFVFKNGPTKFKVVAVAQEYMNLNLRMMLHSMGQIIQNPYSGVLQVLLTKAGSTFTNTSNKELRKQRNKVALNILNDITGNAALSYGNVESNFTSHSKAEDILNKKSDNRIYHRIISAFLGKLHLEAIDSWAKSILTSRHFTENIIKILTDKTNKNGAMSKKEALRYVTENLTGQSFEDAMNTAREIIIKVNEKAGKNVISDKYESVVRLADGIVKHALVSGGKITTEQLEAAATAGYVSAGFSLGHEANNIISKEIGLSNANIDKKIKEAVKEKNYTKATLLTWESIFIKNIMRPFVGGGSNWIILTLQKSGLDLYSLNRDNKLAKSEKIELDTVSGNKNLKNALLRKSNAKNTNVRMLFGAMSSIITFLLWYDDLDDEEKDKQINPLKKWLSENGYAKKYFNYISPTVLGLIISAENEELGKEIGKILGIKSDYFQEGLILTKAVKKINESIVLDGKGFKISDEEKYKSAKGDFGKLFGSKINTPLPWRSVRDVENFYRGINGLPEFKTNYKAKSFTDGLYKGGFVEYLKSNPDKPEEDEADKK